MRNICLFLFASVLATGCIIHDDDDPPGGGFCGDGIVNGGEQCDDGNGSSGDGCSATCTSEGGGGAQITAAWTFRDFPDTVTACPAGFNTIAHYNQLLDANGQASGQPVIDLYDCVDNTNFTDALTPGVYQSWLESTDDSGANVYAQSTSVILDVTTQDASFEAAIFNDAGYFAFGWSLVASSNGSPVTCAQAQADGVEIISTVTNGTAGVTDQFNCEDGFGVTAALLAGSYTVSIDAFQDGGPALTEPVTEPNQIVQDRNRVTSLGDFVLRVSNL